MKDSSISEDGPAAPAYTAAAALDFIKVYAAGVIAFTLFGHLQPPTWATCLFLVVPLLGSCLFGATGLRLPLRQYLIAGVVTGGVVTGAAGVSGLGWGHWLALLEPHTLALAVALVARGTGSYVGGAALGAALGAARA